MKVVTANHFGWHNNVVNHSYGGNNVIADKVCQCTNVQSGWNIYV